VKADQAAEGTSSTGAARTAMGGRLVIEFEVLRGRPTAWAVFGLTSGAVLIAKMGTVAQWVGAVLVGVGVLSVWTLVRSFVRPRGTIVVDDTGVSLPRGHYTTAVDHRPMNQVTAAYFLRRSAPWNRAAPVLVIEAAGKAHTYPRDWFVNEADQRQVIHAVLSRIQPDALPAAPSKSAGGQQSDVQRP